MPTMVAQRRLDVSEIAPAPTRVFHRFRGAAVDLLCMEESAESVPPRMHDRFAIVLLRSPTVVRLEKSRGVVADRGWILLIPARHLYALRAVPSATTGAHGSPVILQVGGPHIEALACAKRPAVISDADVGNRLSSLIAQLQRPLRLADCEESTESLLESLEASSTAIPARAGFALDTLVAVRDFMDARLDQPVSIIALSRFSGLTESHLIRSFHREFGLPPHAYHVQLRLAHAGELLASGLAVSTVTYECGFADQSHLSRKFKQTYGIAPAAWANAVATSRQADVYSSRQNPNSSKT